jgi:hypothetical protein
MNPENMKLTLVIEQRSKAIPYPSELHEDRTNHGFKDLKGDTSAIQTISEAQDCSAFRDALVALNAPETPFFTVGCEKSLNTYGGKFWKKGYLEFSFNYAELVSDATSYFTLFFHFNRAEPLRELLSRHSIRFCWELQQCRFKKVNVGGFTCCIWITTGDYSTAGECEMVWDDAVRHITGFLVASRISKLPPSPRIYGPNSTSAQS